MLILFTCLVATAWSQAQAGQKQEFVTFDVPGAAATVPFYINPGGVIVGEYVDNISFAFHGFVRGPDGSITTVDAPGAGTVFPLGTKAAGINPAGTITGLYIDSKNVTHCFLRAADG